MIALELYHLKRFCDKYELDYQEIDDTLTYWENKDHLKSLVFLNVEDQLKEWGPFLEESRSQEEWYMKEHILSYYIICSRYGETKSEEVGPPMKPRFSLAAYIKSTK